MSGIGRQGCRSYGLLHLSPEAMDRLELHGSVLVWNEPDVVLIQLVFRDLCQEF